MPVTRLSEQLPTTAGWALWAHIVGSCIVFNYTLEKTFYCYGKFCSCASQILPSLLTWVFLQRWKPEELWLSRDKIQRLLGSSLAFFINIFCRVMAYEQSKWKTIFRDCNFIKEEKNKERNTQHLNNCRRKTGPNHSWFYTHQSGLSEGDVRNSMIFTQGIAFKPHTYFLKSAI